MCGRVHITQTIDQLCKEQGLFMTIDQRKLLPNIPHYNLCPGMHLPLTLQGAKRELFALHWGLIPFWAKTQKIGYKMINARLETVLSKSAFKNPVHHQRGVLFINGFYEWVQEQGKNQPYRICAENQELIPLACIHDRWDSRQGAIIHSFSILTKAATPPISYLHDRMPIMLSQEQQEAWLDPNINVKAMIDDLSMAEILKPLDFYPVSKKVNKTGYNQKDALNRIEPNPQSGDQLKLF